jgi:hypothetical protein
VVRALTGGINIEIYDKPTFVYVGSRLGQIFHARICMGCSALNSDLFRKNTVNSLRCTCGAIETPTHYLLNCLLIISEVRLRCKDQKK